MTKKELKAKFPLLKELSYCMKGTLAKLQTYEAWQMVIFERTYNYHKERHESRLEQLKELETHLGVELPKHWSIKT